MMYAYCCLNVQGCFTRLLGKNASLGGAGHNLSTWDMFLPIVMRQVNAQVHSAHGTSPHHIIFGTELSNNMQMFMHDKPFTDYSKLNDTGTLIKDLDNKLDIVYKHALAHLEDTIVDKFGKNQTTDITYNKGDYVLYRNLRISTSAARKFAPVFLGPLKVVNTLVGDFYLCHDLVQDKPLYCHARDMRPFNCYSDDVAIGIAKSDYNEFIIEKVIGHEGDPTSLNNFRIIVTFEGSDTPHHLPIRDLQYVNLVRDYINRTPELSCLKDRVAPKDTMLGSRARKQSQTLTGYDTSRK